MRSELARMSSVSGRKPVWATEAGFQTALRSRDGQPPVSEQAGAVYLLRTFLEHFISGVRRTYAYELLDESAEPALRKSEQHFGLLRHDFSPKPAYTALRNLLALMGPDQGRAARAPAGAPRPARARLGRAPPGPAARRRDGARGAVAPGQRLEPDHPASVRVKARGVTSQCPARPPSASARPVAGTTSRAPLRGGRVRVGAGRRPARARGRRRAPDDRSSHAGRRPPRAGRSPLGIAPDPLYRRRGPPPRRRARRPHDRRRPRPVGRPPAPRGGARRLAAALGLALAAAPAAEAAFPRYASAAAFRDSVGIATHPSYYDTPYGQWDKVVARLRELGVHHIRGGFFASGNAGWQARQAAAYRDAYAAGIRSNLVLDLHCSPTGSVDPCLAGVKAELPAGSVESVEWLNEHDLFGGTGWKDVLQTWGRALYTKVKADPVLRSLRVIGPSLVAPNAPQVLRRPVRLPRRREHPPLHRRLEPEPAPHRRRAGPDQGRLGSKPVVATEAGFHTSPAATNVDQPAADEPTAAVYTLRTVLEHFATGSTGRTSTSCSTSA